MPGVWRAAAYCSGAAVIFHSPRACAHVARSMDISAQYRALANGAAENLNLSEGTVRNYLSGILNKLEFRDRTQLAIWAVQNKVATKITEQ